MKTHTKILLGVAGVIALVYWALTTKNEVIESAVYPLKIKLGLVKASR
jgi:hypothetical protein